ncbi:MAG: YoaK family protein [Archangium sp.]
MVWRRTPAWVLVGGAWLAFTAGFVNAIAFLGAAHAGLTHVSGQVTQVSLTLRDGNLLATASAAGMVVAFFLGAVLSGAIIRTSELSRGSRRYGVALLLEAGFLFVAAFLTSRGSSWSAHFVAMSAGMQNALATSYSGAVIRTTHMTGIVTDLGLIIGHALRGQPAEWGRMKLLSLLLFSFFFGGALGAVAYSHFTAPMLIPAWGIVAAGLSWLWISTRQKAEDQQSVEPQKN